MTTSQQRTPPPTVHICIDCVDPEALAPFWAAALGYEIGTTLPGETYLLLVPPDASYPGVYLQKVPEGKLVKNRLHLDLRVPDADGLIRRLEALGASRLGEPRSGSACAWWQVMADPVGNEFCVCSTEC